MATLKEIEAQIAALQRRQSELDANVKKHGVFDGDVISAQGNVATQIRSLQSRRVALLSGIEDPQSTIKLTPQPKPPQLRPPRRLTSKKAREAAVEVCRQAEETAFAMPVDTPLQDLLSIYGSTDTFASIEQDLLHFGETAVPSGLPCEFSEKLYAGFVALVWQSTANDKAMAHFQSNQRRRLEQRVEALEAGERHFTSGEKQGLAAYMRALFEAPLLKRLEELEQQQSGMKYRGVWSGDEQYVPGNFCTDHGSLWHCNQTTRERPGVGRAWTLAVKKGQDGKDAVAMRGK